ELTLRTENFKAKTFSWSTNFNVAVARNKLLSFPGLENSTYVNRYVIGESTSIIKVYQSLGVNPQTGLYEVADLNGDGIITAAGDKQAIANLTPKYFGGLQNSLRYKQWQLNFLFQFVKQDTYKYSPAVQGGAATN